MARAGNGSETERAEECIVSALQAKAGQVAGPSVLAQCPARA